MKVLTIDTNVPIDAFDPSAPAHGCAAALIRNGLLGSGVAIYPVILAEVCVGDRSHDSVALPHFKNNRQRSS